MQNRVLDTITSLSDEMRLLYDQYVIDYQTPDYSDLYCMVVLKWLANQYRSALDKEDLIQWSKTASLFFAAIEELLESNEEPIIDAILSGIVDHMQVVGAYYLPMRSLMGPRLCRAIDDTVDETGLILPYTGQQ